MPKLLFIVSQKGQDLSWNRPKSYLCTILLASAIYFQCFAWHLSSSSTIWHWLKFSSVPQSNFHSGYKSECLLPHCFSSFVSLVQIIETLCSIKQKLPEKGLPYTYFFFTSSICDILLVSCQICNCWSRKHFKLDFISFMCVLQFYPQNEHSGV